MKKNSRYTKWMSFSIGGLLLIGFGVSLIGEAIQLKATYPDEWG